MRNSGYFIRRTIPWVSTSQNKKKHSPRDQLLSKDNNQRANVYEFLHNIQKSHILFRRWTHMKKTGALKYIADDDEVMLKSCRREQL